MVRLVVLARQALLLGHDRLRRGEAVVRRRARSRCSRSPGLGVSAAQEELEDDVVLRDDLVCCLQAVYASQV